MGEVHPPVGYEARLSLRQNGLWGKRSDSLTPGHASHGLDPVLGRGRGGSGGGPKACSGGSTQSTHRSGRGDTA